MNKTKVKLGNEGSLGTSNPDVTGGKPTDGQDIYTAIDSLNNKNTSIESKLDSIINSISTLDTTVASLQKSSTEHWFKKNLKSPNFFSIWFPALVAGIITSIVYVGKLVIRDNSKEIKQIVK